MKDMCAWRPIAEYVGLCPTMYFILEAGGKNLRMAKSVWKNVVKKRTYHEQYTETLLDNETLCA